MSEDPTPDRFEQEEGEDVEVLDGVPVLVEARELVPAPAALPAVQAAAVAAGGFFAGALTMALLKRYSARRLADTALEPAPLGSWAPGTSRTYLVNVRLVSGSE